MPGNNGFLRSSDLKGPEIVEDAQFTIDFGVESGEFAYGTLRLENNSTSVEEIQGLSDIELEIMMNEGESVIFREIDFFPFPPSDKVEQFVGFQTENVEYLE